MEVIKPNSFGSLLEVGDVDKWALSIIEGSPAHYRWMKLKSKAVVDFLGSSSVGFCCHLETRVREGNFDSVSRRFGNSWDYSCSYSNSGVGRIWVMWKKNRFSFSTHVRDEQFITGTVVMEDFNAIRGHSEACGGSPIQGEMEDFDMAIRDADLVEPSVQRNWFTWTSKVQGSGMMRRLDRVLLNDDWLSAWPTMLVNVLPWGISDHSPILLYPSFQQNSKVSRHEGVSPLVRLMRNLNLLKPILRRRFGRHIRSLSEEVRIAKEAMDIAQRELDWRSLALAEISNSLVKAGVSSHDGVAQMAVNYFSNSLGSQEIGYRELTPIIDDIVQFQWSEECCQALQVPISREEVRRVLFSMDSGKAPGPDGFSVGFFKGAWSVIGEDFCDAVLHFFETYYLPVGVNATAITLIPKHNGAERLEDFRPISCCNVLYKCISKILADRLRVWLPSFISSNQSAFILGRSIIENILLCQELVGGYHLNSGKPRCTLKVDLQKAYDSVNWDFLFGLQISISTPLKFVSWISACVTSPMFSIMINGSLEGFFHGRKGVRQGDPLSLFLFVMVMEVLSRMLNKIPQSFQFHHRCEKRFGELSGLFANPRKSSIFIAGVNNENASRLAACMGFVRGNLPVRYLGLPLLTGRLRSNDCVPLIQRITSRIRSRSARVLSFAGRLQLVCSVLCSLQVYWAIVFVLPAYVHNEEGGLGIRDGTAWKFASTLKILWLMLTNSGSLWVAWVEAYVLKGRSLWDVDSRVGRSWCLRAILRKQEKLKQHVRMKVGNGNRCRVWLDPWLQRGAILERVGERVLYDAASRREASLSNFIGPDGEWLWPRGGFSIASAWEAIRPRGGRVLWDGLLWGGGNIPKHSFCAWLAIKDRLGTRDRFHRWDSSVPLSCILCEGGMESRDHLFFSCPFGGDVWSRVLRIMASSHRIGHWGVELSWICHQGIRKGVRRKLWRVLWCATIYFIWNERNHRLHGGQAPDPIVIFHLICTWIRARAGSWREDAYLPF
ncbi:reverse transcriptase [Cucumis melo var. makuwa]|uniref:Reverse transcriptase n=1 Tax=Cucumis melo var. makuwa TaxID=1194695 RepID=A0A5D3D7P6_CUCMM|nr:reverse transcriptase [Cucumis melo var. makuwa]